LVLATDNILTLLGQNRETLGLNNELRKAVVINFDLQLDLAIQSQLDLRLDSDLIRLVNNSDFKILFIGPNISSSAVQYTTLTRINRIIS
jgi:hypothetical protein